MNQHMSDNGGDTGSSEDEETNFHEVTTPSERRCDDDLEYEHLEGIILINLV